VLWTGRQEKKAPIVGVLKKKKRGKRSGKRKNMSILVPSQRKKRASGPVLTSQKKQPTPLRFYGEKRGRDDRFSMSARGENFYSPPRRKDTFRRFSKKEEKEGKERPPFALQREGKRKKLLYQKKNGKKRKVSHSDSYQGGRLNRSCEVLEKEETRVV